MKKIHSYSELQIIKQRFCREVADYLEEEFKDLYEYLSNGQGVDEFILPDHQTMVILELDEEFKKVIQKSLDMEYMEEVYMKDVLILRIGIRNLEEVQLHYNILPSYKSGYSTK
ncbi:hypothetical protein [Virgibacillus sp. L01]|uniref:hypothetical protein n=1 Tax=Virgibacillus sp. L01 TaxID=3457429 RepID=UPI003FD168A6